VIPFGDDQGRIRFVVTTFALFVGIVGVYVYQWSLGPSALQTLVSDYGFVAQQVVAPFRPLEVGEPARHLAGLLSSGFLPFVTYPFLHSGPIHMASCALALWTFGSRLESRTSWWRFLSFFLLCSIAGGIAQVWWGSHPESVHLGATVPVASVALAYLALYPKARTRVLLLPLPLFARIPAIVSVLLFAVLQFHKVQGFFGLDCGVSLGYVPQVGSILLGGLVLGPLLLGRRRRVASPAARAAPSTSKRKTSSASSKRSKKHTASRLYARNRGS
jgi:rhomboid family protein